MKESYKICFLGYQELTEMARKTIEDMKLSDTEFMLRDCTPDSLREVLDEAVTAGYEIFIGGGSNYARFKQISSMYIQELQVTEVDYLTALRKSEACGHNPGNPLTSLYYHNFSEDKWVYWYTKRRVN